MTPTDPPREVPARPRTVNYKGEPLDAARGPGLGCFWIQAVALGIFVLLTPLSVAWGWPEGVSAALLISVLLLLLFVGQTTIFLLRLVAADRRAAGRRPMASGTKTVGELEADAAASPGVEAVSSGATAARPQTPAEDRTSEPPPAGDDRVRE